MIRHLFDAFYCLFRCNAFCVLLHQQRPCEYETFMECMLRLDKCLAPGGAPTGQCGCREQRQDQEVAGAWQRAATRGRAHVQEDGRRAARLRGARSASSVI